MLYVALHTQTSRSKYCAYIWSVQSVRSGQEAQNGPTDQTDPKIKLVCNPSILSSNGIDLRLKAASQKVGLAEVLIRLIREIARATKAGIRVKFGY